MRIREYLLLLLGFLLSASQSPAGGISPLADSATTFTLTSSPAGAKIFIDSIFVGVSPIVIDTLSHRRVLMRFEMDGYYPTAFHAQVLPDSSARHIHAALRSRTALLSIASDQGPFTCVLDDTLRIEGPFSSRRVPDGVHTFALTHHESGRTIHAEVNLASGSDTVLEARFKVRSVKPVFWSAIFPGTAHFGDKAFWSGAAYLAGSAASLTAVLTLNATLHNRKQDYSVTYQFYKFSRTEDEAIERRAAAQQAVDAANHARTSVNIAIGAFAGIYLANLIDAWFNHAYADELVPAEATNKAHASVLVRPEISNTKLAIGLYVTF